MFQSLVILDQFIEGHGFDLVYHGMYHNVRDMGICFLFLGTMFFFFGGGAVGIHGVPQNGVYMVLVPYLEREKDPTLEEFHASIQCTGG